MQSYQLCTLIDLENCKLFLIQFWKMSESLLLHSFWICSNIQCFPGRNSLKRRTLSENGNLEYIFIKSSTQYMHTESHPNAHRIVSLNVCLPHPIAQMGLEKLAGKFLFFGRENESLLRGNIQSVLFSRKRLLCLWCVILKN